MSPSALKKYVLRIAVIGGLVWLIYGLVFDNSGWIHQEGIAKGNTETQHRIDSLNRLNASLRDSIRRLQSDTALLEDLARKELGMTKPGEVLYHFIPDSATQTPIPER